ncbi:Glycosyl transferase [Macleaya cordata]|uniref:1,3-beta-glucan synthase n=1 Tax=Macleaya cordata TaxID=56857 RepID=A0A200Q0F3_MACCD|nr:Glycosyl transferase [Macleaya cordata]
MAEIVVVAEDSSSVHGTGRNSSSSNNKRPITRAKTVGCLPVPEPFDSEKLPPTLVSDIRRFLRVANQIEFESPRVAYLCRFHAFERAHMMDPSSSGRGVRQFKTSLLQRLELDEEATFLKRKEKSDVRELKGVYHKYEAYILKYDGDSLENREQLMSARAIASVLFEVLKSVTSGVGLENIVDGEDVDAYNPYNILPLDRAGERQAIMQLPEIKAAVAAVRNIRGLPSAENDLRPGASMDLLDWLESWFGFQKGNVANQREHLILLLANIHVRQTHKQSSMSKLGENAVDGLMKKLFGNYKNWCNFLGRKSNIWLPTVKQEVHQHKILYIGLYLLIWGEASNLRFMPECLCYIFHHMAYELHGLLSGAVSLTAGEKVRPAYGGGSESFLMNVVTPIYRVIYKEAKKNKSGTADHSKWRNYDDLNEFFWSPDCFQLGWPFRLDHDFFCVEPPVNSHIRNNMAPIEDRDQRWLGKTNFVEIRSFWQLFRSFDRMWSFYILSLQAMIIMAWHGLGSPFELFEEIVFEDIMSIFITSAVFKFLLSILDIAFTWKARHTMDFSQILRYMLKPVIAAIWIIVLSVYYADSRRKSTCSRIGYGSWVGEWCFSSYMVTVAFYLMSNAVGMILFLVPAVRRYIENSNWKVFIIFSWWAQPRLYVARGMQESMVSLFKYTLFWVLLLLSKFSFSYYYEIKPLVEPTKQIMRIGVNKYDWHELFPKVKSNAGAIIAVWAPIVLVYFMDTQIWYSVFCTIFGGVYGIFRHLGEIRTMGMLRSRFHSLPYAFDVRLVPPSLKNDQKRNKKSFLKWKIQKESENKRTGSTKFAHVWNQIINSFRSEDLISNREMDLMTIPMSLELDSVPVHWPVFLLSTKFSTALSMARDYVGEDENLFRKIEKDNYMYCAVKECYESLKYILNLLVVGELEKTIISYIIDEVETSISRSSVLVDFRMSELPGLHIKCIELVDLLFENTESDHDKVVMILQDIFEIVTKDMMIHGSRLLDMLYSSQPIEEDEAAFFEQVQPQLFTSNDNPAILFPLPDSGPFKEQIKRLLLLLTVKETALEIPMNLEARRRISFFATSLFMDMPCAPKVRNMLSFSVMTPHYKEEVNFSMEKLHSSQEGVSIIFYMQKIYPDEWKNFLERMECGSWEDLQIKGKGEELRNWASFRAQTLSRTVRGMMYYRKALKLQAFLDMAEDEDILEDYKATERGDDRKNNPHSLSAQLDALADMKFTYIVSCQAFGAQKSSGDSRAQDIIDLMIRYRSLRVAYVEEKEEIGIDKPKKVYSSILVKAINNLDQEIYRIKLPGTPNIGEGKPENQNHAIIFTRGDALQTIDMNQDNYMEEALKMRNVLQEFLRHQGRHSPTILGLREHIFTGSVSSLSWFMTYQETSFVTIGQRLLANPLRVRFHYGHTDLFDRVFHLTRGGISKASRTINLSEDVFAGFNSILRRGYVTYHEYMQVGKGRDVGLNQISKFEAKIAYGNSEQTLSRDIYRLGHRFNFFRMLSCYFTTVGFYFNCLLSVIGVYVFLYGQLYLVLSGLEKALLLEARMQNIESLETALASQSFIQLGLLTGLPMVMEIGLERGFLTALKDFILMQLQLAAVFFTFSLGIKSHYYGRTILHGGAKYMPTGRKVVVFHASFTENYRLYSRSHFVKGFELLLLLIVYNLFRRPYQSSMTYVLITYSIWFMLATWLFAPFLFNPSGFNWGKIVDDWTDWNKWMKNQGGIGVHQDKSWESWWNDEQAHLRHSGIGARILQILLSVRFFIYQYGMVYHLDIAQQNKNFLVYVLSWLVIAVIFILAKAMNEGRRRLSTSNHFLFRLLKAFLFLGVLSVIITLSVICDLSPMDLIVCSLAFLPTGWGLTLIAQAVRSKIEEYELWDFVRVLAQAYDYGMGVVLFAPMAALAWLPIISAFQTRFLFNEAFSRRLQIQPILAGRKKHS